MTANPIQIPESITIHSAEEHTMRIGLTGREENLQIDQSQPRFMRLRLGDIFIPEFQRAENRTQILRISRNFSWTLFGALSVWRSIEDNGRLYAIDGQQRMAALRHRGNLEVQVPAMYYEGISYQQAARIYHDINAPGSKRALTQGDLLKAELAICVRSTSGAGPPISG